MKLGGLIPRLVNGAIPLMLNRRNSEINGQEQIIQSGNNCNLPLRVTLLDEREEKKLPTKEYHDSDPNRTSIPHSPTSGQT